MDPMLLAGLAFVGVVCLAAIVIVAFGGNKSKLESRLDDLASQAGPVSEQAAMRAITKSALPKLGAQLMDSAGEKEKTQLRARLVQAGFYNPSAAAVFLTVKMITTFGPLVFGLVSYFVLGRSSIYPLMFGAVGAVFGLVGPSFWLDNRKNARQLQLRRAMPDGMDVIVICLEGGLSLPAAFARVAEEMRVAHPLLAFELNILQREIQLGKNTGEALREMAARTGMEEIRSLSAVIMQAEKYGSSMAKALRIHADTLRLQRTQKAEELAAKAGTKILFPTLLFIFPAIFVVILGPAAFQIIEMFSKTGAK